MVEEVRIELLQPHPESRKIIPATVAQLKESIAENGLIQPVRVRPKDGRYQIVAGRHRVEACRELGMETIAAIVRDDDDDGALMTLIDENLARADLTPAERAQQTARRKEVYERRHPETKQGAVNQYTAASASRQIGDKQNDSENKRFTANTAAATGQSERAIQRDAERGKKISPEVLAKIKGTPLDTGEYLDRLKKKEYGDQHHMVDRDLKQKKKNVRNASARQRKRTALAAMNDDDQKAEREFERLKTAWQDARESVQNRFVQWLDKLASDKARKTKGG